MSASTIRNGSILPLSDEDPGRPSHCHTTKPAGEKKEENSVGRRLQGRGILFPRLSLSLHLPAPSPSHKGQTCQKGGGTISGPGRNLLGQEHGAHHVPFQTRLGVGRLVGPLCPYIHIRYVCTCKPRVKYRVSPQCVLVSLPPFCPENWTVTGRGTLWENSARSALRSMQLGVGFSVPDHKGKLSRRRQ